MEGWLLTQALAFPGASTENNHPEPARVAGRMLFACSGNIEEDCYMDRQALLSDT
jgi:hypothetical protein